MADAIPKYPRYLGTNYTIYAITAVDQGGNIVASAKKLAGADYAENPSGEIIVALDWR